MTINPSQMINRYEVISEYIRSNTFDQIVEDVLSHLGCRRETLLENPMGGYGKGHTSGCYKHVLSDLITNIDYYDWLYDRLVDESSRIVYANLILFRIIPDKTYIKMAFDGINPQYFDKSIVECDENEVFVDCGGFVGDTVMSFIDSYGKYKRIYTYEPEAANIVKCKENLKDFDNIVIRQAGVGEKPNEMTIFGTGSSTSFVKFSTEDEGVTQAVVSLDSDIKEPVTFIKMDIEGFEIPGILGAKNHIKNDHPKLAICLYHIFSDIWEIPKLISYIREDYDYYLRHYWEEENWETVLYAIPKKEPVKSKSEGKKRVVAMAPYERPWTNVELIKDCGLVPYLLYKNHGCEASMVGANGGEYPYRDLVDGMKLEFLKDGSKETKLSFIEKEGKDIDFLILRGCYDHTRAVAAKYREVNPDGRIYVGLDANSEWMDRIRWDIPDFKDFIYNCDILGTSCTALAEYLSKKWPRKVSCFPNGYYDFYEGTNGSVSYKDKEKTILTVSRLGTAQKDTATLLMAFLKAHDKLPGWKLRLVGSMEDGFKPEMDKFLNNHPELRECIEFVGPISDRKQLMLEYERASIFILSSVVEGAPNVVSEALHGGCRVVTTKVDAYMDMTAGGKCGRYCEIKDVDGLADALISECLDPQAESRSNYAREYAEEFLNMERIVEDLYERLSN